MGYITGLADRIADVLALNIISTMYHLCMNFYLQGWCYFPCAYYQRTIVRIVMSGSPPWKRSTISFLLASDQTEHYLSLCGASWTSPENDRIWGVTRETSGKRVLTENKSVPPTWKKTRSMCSAEISKYFLPYFKSQWWERKFSKSSFKDQKKKSVWRFLTYFLKNT